MLVLSVARSLRTAVPRQNPAKSQRLFDEHGGAFAVAAEEQNILHLNSLTNLHSLRFWPLGAD